MTAHAILLKRLVPCERRYPREVPPLPWYRTTVPQMLMAGFLPFSAIYIELYYIFASVWGHKAREPCFRGMQCSVLACCSFCCLLMFYSAMDLICPLAQGDIGYGQVLQGCQVTMSFS